MAKETSVLVLDDEQNILHSLKRVFMSESFEIATTTDAEEAFRVLEKEKVKVVMSDQRMPGVTGVEFLKKVKEKYPDIVRILFTGYTDIQAAEDAINKGEVYRFINKPWNDEDLKSTIREAVKHFDLVAENKRLFELTQKQNEELKSAYERLSKIYEKQKQFTSTVSHELRTPLTSIKGAIDILMGEKPGPLTDAQRDLMGIAKRNVDRQNRLVSDILDLTKLEEKAGVLNKTDVNINLLIHDVVQIHKGVAAEKGLLLKEEIDSQMKPVQMDSDRINQVLINLVNNALKFTEKGSVSVSSVFDTTRNIVQVSVADTGVGIREEDKPKLFQKFVQLDVSIEKRVGGTGLGLAICMEIISQHGGKIWVDSEPGKGSSFNFLLPIVERRSESGNEVRHG